MLHDVQGFILFLIIALIVLISKQFSIALELIFLEFSQWTLNNWLWLKFFVWERWTGAGWSTNGQTYFHQLVQRILVDILESMDYIWMVIDGTRCYYMLSCLLLCATFTGCRRSHTPFGVSKWNRPMLV